MAGNAIKVQRFVGAPLWTPPLENSRVTEPTEKETRKLYGVKIIPPGKYIYRASLSSCIQIQDPQLQLLVQLKVTLAAILVLQIRKPVSDMEGSLKDKSPCPETKTSY